MRGISINKYFINYKINLYLTFSPAPLRKDGVAEPLEDLFSPGGLLVTFLSHTHMLKRVGGTVSLCIWENSLSHDDSKHSNNNSTHIIQQ